MEYCHKVLFFAITLILSFNFKCTEERRSDYLPPYPLPCLRFDMWNGTREEEMNTIGIAIDILKYY